MSAFELASILLAIAALLGYVNLRFLKLPTTIGIMLITMGFSVSLIILGQFFPSVPLAARQIISQIDFNETLLDVMLSFLLFAGALHVDLSDLARQKRIIAFMATLSVLISTFLIGTTVFYLLPFFHVNLSYLHCLLFGALISPTDPVAVLGILKNAGAPESLRTKITGESLFNDGVGVVVFLALLGIATGHGELSLGHIGQLFLIEVLGGIIFGGVLGALGFYMLKSIDDYQIEVLITLALVTGGYSLAHYLHTSGPLAMVVAGLMIGNHGRTLAMSNITRKHLDLFWELIDEILNAVLFTLIGLELLIIPFTSKTLLLGVICIPLVIAARFIAVGVPVTLLRPWRKFSRGVIPILTWAGLRGGISVALALSLPENAGRPLFLALTYIIVVFSLTVQGLTIKPLCQRLTSKEATE